MNNLKLQTLLQTFFLEDIGDGDVTNETVFSSHPWASGHFIAKQDGVIAGVDIVTEGYRIMDPKIEAELNVHDGETVKKGTSIATVKGPTLPLLSGERVILNLLQRMSGIATTTAHAVHLVTGEHAKICDTRKTVPGLRMLDKYAVRCGGGFNHRFGLYDGVLIKDNHIACLGSIEQAVRHVKEQLGHMVKIEVETESREDVLASVEAGVDVIMFDNRTPEEIREYLIDVPESIVTEASGNIDFDRLKDYAATGVDYISLGRLTHTVNAFDMSLDMQP